MVIVDASYFFCSEVVWSVWKAALVDYLVVFCRCVISGLELVHFMFCAPGAVWAVLFSRSKGVVVVVFWVYTGSGVVVFVYWFGVFAPRVVSLMPCLFSSEANVSSALECGCVPVVFPSIAWVAFVSSSCFMPSGLDVWARSCVGWPLSF